MDYVMEELTSPEMNPPGMVQPKLPTVTYTLNDAHDGKRTLDVYLTDQILPAYLYSEIASVFLLLGEADSVNIHLHTPGGFLETAQLFSHLIENCRCRNNVTGIAHGNVISAGTPILLACTHIQIAPGAHFMFHSSRHGDMGKTATIKSQSEAMMSFVNGMIRRMVERGMLKEEEYKRIAEGGQDVYISGSEMAVRLGLVEAPAQPAQEEPTND